MKLNKFKWADTGALVYLSYAIMLIGAALRLSVYFQNRNLFIDEADLARNIYERNFVGLIHPLSYFQYAPPLFLWGAKLCAMILGYGEYALKVVPLLSGIGTIILMYLLLQKYEVKKVAWYPLFLLSTGIIYLRYATEFKQYSSDCLIALGLIYLALSVDSSKMGIPKFVSIWIYAGSIAVWGSMPSVFILAGVGSYYFALFYSTGGLKKIYALIIPVAMWIAQFLLYYFIILKPQIQSDYLQNFHRADFLYLIPTSMHELYHNWEVMIHILGVAAGHWGLSIVFHILLIVIAAYFAVKRKMLSILLVVIPMFLLLLAAALHQYTLAPRIVLFIMPVILILIAIGFEQSFSYKYIRAIFVLASVVCMYNFNQLIYFYKPLQVQQVTDCLHFLKAQKITGPHLYIHPAGIPIYAYYTGVHPGKAEWEGLSNGIRLDYNINYDSLAQTMKGRSAMLYGFEHPENIVSQQATINKHSKPIAHYATVASEVFIYAPGNEDSQ
jgi:hypothetical protein